MKAPTTKVSIISYGRSMRRGLKLIDRFKEINDLHFDLEIKIDFDEPDLGYFNYHERDKALYINPLTSARWTNKKDVRTGHPRDNSICATIIHEFSHYLDKRFHLLKEYQGKKFALKSLVFTPHGKKDIIEELADLLALYMLNPYFVLLADRERFMWMKSRFKSPSVCGKKTFVKYWYLWTPKQRKRVRDGYGINVISDEIYKY